MKKIGILGGTFDPFHNQHLKIAQTAYKKLQLDEVWILPTKQNPLKDEVSATTQQRLNMIKLVIKDYSWMKLNKYELSTKETNYTINTMQHFLEKYPNTKFFFIIGADNLHLLEQWKDIEILINIIKIVVVNRPHFNKTLQLMKKYHCRNLVVHPSSTISSSLIRNGQVTNQTPLSITNYINDNLLYVLDRLKFNLSEGRVKHSLNVGSMAEKLAKNHHLNFKKAKIAGIYHDLCKQWSKNKMKKYLKKYQPEILEEPFPVWHGYVASWFLKNHYGYQDLEIISAVAKHTTGAISMTPLELVVLLADKVAIERNFPHVEKLRALSFQDLNLAFKYYLEILKINLENKNQKLNKNFTNIYEAWYK